MTVAQVADQSGGSAHDEVRCLSVNQLSVTIGKAQIVSSLSFEARAGELLAIIGPSGSGKTTLLKAVTGELPYRGQAVLAGADICGLTPEAQANRRGVLPQISQIAFALTVAEVVSLGLSGLRLDRPGKARRIGEALEKVGLGGFEARSYQDLSGGEQQRVQLARVLCQVWEPVPDVGPPRWLFLDEPVSSLDIKHQYQIMALARDYALRGGGVVAVMHDLNLTAAFADKILVMQKGQRLAFGARDEVMQADLLSRAYDFPLALVPCHETGRPVVVPRHQGEGAQERTGPAH